MTRAGAPELRPAALPHVTAPADATWSPEEEQADPRALSWPGSRLGSLVGACALFGAMVLPVALSDASPAARLLALPAVAAIVLVARWLSHSRVLEPGARAMLRRAADEAPVALAVTIMLVLALFVAGVPVRAGGIALTGLLVLTALTLAAAAAAVETRMLIERRRVLFVGSRAQRELLARELMGRSDVRLVGALTVPATGATISAHQSIVDCATDLDATMVVVNRRLLREKPVLAAVGDLHRRGRRVRTLGTFYEQTLRKVALDELTPEWFLSDVAEIHDPGVYGRMKRVMESVVAGVVLALAIPLLPMIWMLVRVSSPGPVFFAQERVGRDGVPFRMTKFRTMRATPPGPQRWASEDLVRLTAVGRFLRRFRLDELPQLVSVLRGEMSLVGPRPEQPELVARLEREIPFYSARHAVRPGITGWAQVNAGYCDGVGGGRTKLSYDLYYVRHQSLRLDLAIIASTARAMLRGHGAS